MDKKSLIGLGLIAVILITWLALAGPNKEQLKRNKDIKDSIEFVEKTAMDAEKLLAEVASKKLLDSVKVVTSNLSDSAKFAIASNKYKDFSVSANGTKEIVTIENENIKVYVSTKGAVVEKVELKKYNRYGKKSPLILFDKDSTFQQIKFDAYSNMKFSTDSFYFKTSDKSIIVSGADSKTLVLKLETATPGTYIEYIYTLKGNDYMLDYDVNFVGMQNIISNKAHGVKIH